MTDLWHNAEWRERLKQSQSIWITACILVSLALVLLVALNSGFAYREAQAFLERRTGLDLQAGSSRLTLMPFGLQMSDVSCSRGMAAADKLLPLRLSQSPCSGDRC